MIVVYDNVALYMAVVANVVRHAKSPGTAQDSFLFLHRVAEGSVVIDPCVKK